MPKWRRHSTICLNYSLSLSLSILSYLVTIFFLLDILLRLLIFWGNWIISISYLYKEKCKKVHKIRLNKNSDNWLNFCSIFGTSKDEFETQVKTLLAWSLHHRIFQKTLSNAWLYFRRPFIIEWKFG